MGSRSRGARPERVVGTAAAVLLGSVALVLLTVEDISSIEERDLAVPVESHRLALLQLDAAQAHMDALNGEGLAGAISALRDADGASRARFSSLAHAGW
jgi:hypothetical protein